MTPARPFYALLLLGSLAGCEAATVGTRPGSQSPFTPYDAGTPRATSAEVCNGLDDDGDGDVDEVCSCSETAPTQSCWPGDPRLRGQGACRDGVQMCEISVEFGEWGACVGAVLPVAEIYGNCIDEDCNGIAEGCNGCAEFEECGNGRDDDCNGLADCDDPACDCGGEPECVPTTPILPIPGFDAIELYCDNDIDDDCDGLIDCEDPECQGRTGCVPECTEVCVPGAERYCDTPVDCAWGLQECGPSGRWGSCRETDQRPGDCSQTGWYDQECCEDQGGCCQNFWREHPDLPAEASVGSCDGITEVTCVDPE